MLVEAEHVAARLTRIKTLIDTFAPICLKNETLRETLLELKQELEAARISVRPVLQVVDGSAPRPATLPLFWAIILVPHL